MHVPSALLALISSVLCCASLSAADSWTFYNPSGRAYKSEPIRVPVSIPGGDFHVLAGGQVVPHHVVSQAGQSELWVVIDVEATTELTLEVKAGAQKSKPLVQVQETADGLVMDNGLLAVRLPKAGKELLSPISAVRWQGGKWCGKGFWQTKRALEECKVEVLADGAAFGLVRLHYIFADKGYAHIDVALYPGRRHVTIRESHALDRGDYWEFNVAAGWSPKHADIKPHSMGFGRWKEGEVPFPPTTLAIGQTRMHDNLLNLIPRWSQAYDDGWYAAAHDEQHAIAAMAVRAGQWQWPHNNMIQTMVKASGDYAGFRCPVWKGRRYWFLCVGPQETWAGKAKHGYVSRYGFYPLDKLLADFVLDWVSPPPDPNKKKPKKPKKPPVLKFSGRDLYNGGAMNPTGMLRGVGRNAVKEAGKPGSYGTLTHAQWMLHPDTYGAYWEFWSSENPNFFTDFIKSGVADISRLKHHPRFKDLCHLAEMKLREDFYHSVTLPGGAGQECPGYLSHALYQWDHLIPVCRDHLGFDPSKWPRYEAAYRFLAHLSQPAGDVRLFHPAGDTHNGKGDPAVQAAAKGFPVAVASLKTEELPGFGVVFRKQPATADETYMSFKAGPNRGHYHGDQLSFHLCANAHPVAVDHHCSYSPRAGQEHMHNRLAFRTKDLPYANMDGYERLIAFKQANGVACAIAQVESERLRITEKLPPERWDWYLPEQRFDKNLAYRRSIVHVTAGERNYFVIRDQYQGPALDAIYCLHVRGEKQERDGQNFQFEGLHLSVPVPATFETEQLDWEHSNGGLERTKGLRLISSGDKTEFITVLQPRPAQAVQALRLQLPDGIFLVGKKGGKAPAPRAVELDIYLNEKQEITSATLRAAGMIKPGLKVPVKRNGDAYSLAVTIPDGRRHKGGDYQLQFSAAVKDGVCSGSFTGSFAGQAVKGDVSGQYLARSAGFAPQYQAAWQPLPVKNIDGGIQVGEDKILFAGGIDDDDNQSYCTVTLSDGGKLAVSGSDIDLHRSQGEIGLFVPDAGYPFGVIPEWLIKQRTTQPEWYRDPWPLGWARKK